MFKKIKPLFFTACMGILGAVALQFSLSVQAAHALPPRCEYNTCVVDKGIYVCAETQLESNCSSDNSDNKSECHTKDCEKY